ncbi:MAG: DUF2442 domain-containing protein [Methylococcales bacterium]
MESVMRVLPKDNFFLELWFDNGAYRLFDARPYLDRGVFVSLKDPDCFNKAYVSYGTVCWPGNIDIAPETLYDKSLSIICNNTILIP